LPSSSSEQSDLGLAMAIEAARILLADRMRMQAAVATWPVDSPAANQCGIIISPTGQELLPADDRAPEQGFRRVFVQSDKSGWLRAVGRPVGIGFEEALAQLREAIAVNAEARLALLSRAGSVEFRFEGQGRTRRLAISPDDERHLLAMVKSCAQDQHGRPGAGGAHSSSHTDWLPPPVSGSGRGLDPARSAQLLEALGIADGGGQIRRDQRRKYNQISHLAALAREALESMPRHREFLVVDSGCGTSQLLMVLNHLAIEELGLRARFVGIDEDPKAIERARALQARLGYANMEFVRARILEWPAPDRVDMVVSLHACDTATDEALALGIIRQARAILAVPCCQAEVAAQISAQRLASVLAHGVLRRRLGDWLTDAVRSLVLETRGYDVKVLEYVSPLDTPKNLMLMALAGDVSKGRRHAAQQALDTLLRDYAIDPALPKLLAAGVAIEHQTSPRRRGQY